MAEGTLANYKLDPVQRGRRRARWQDLRAPGGAPSLAKQHQSSSNARLHRTSLAFAVIQFIVAVSLCTLRLQCQFFPLCAPCPSSLLLDERRIVGVRAHLVAAMASDGPTLERSGEVRERPSLEGQQQEPHHDATGLHRTPEIHETESGNVELRKDPGHTSKPLANHPEQILDPRGASVASKPQDILAVRRDETDTHLE